MIIRNVLLFLFAASIFNTQAMQEKQNLCNLVSMREYSVDHQAARIALNDRVHDVLAHVVMQASHTLSFEKLVKFLPLMQRFHSIIDPVISVLYENQNLNENNLKKIESDFLVILKNSGDLKFSKVKQIEHELKNLRQELALLLESDCFTDNERYLFETCFANSDFLKLQRVYAPLFKKFTRKMSQQDKQFIIALLGNNPNAPIVRTRLLFFPLFLAFPEFYIQSCLTMYQYLQMKKYEHNILKIFSRIDQVALFPSIIDRIIIKKNKVKLSERYWLIELASVDGADEVIRYFLSCGFYPDFVDEKGRSALHEAILVGNLKNVAALIEGGASLDIRNKEGETALDVADQLKNDFKSSLKIYTMLKTFSKSDEHVNEIDCISII